MNNNIKSRFVITVLVSVLFVCSSCEDTYKPIEAKKSMITVTSSDLLFDPCGGTGSIGFDSKEPVTAYSEQPWCSVDVQGNVVSVKVGEYGDLENRYASIVLKAAGDSVKVTAQQNGIVMVSDARPEYLLSDKQSEIKFNVKSNGDIKLASSAAWLRCAIADDKVTVTVRENSSGHVRNGWFTYSSGNSIDTVKVAQAEVQDFYGNYKFMGYDSKSALVYVPASISAGTGENELDVIFTPVGVTWKAKAVFDPLTHKISFQCGQYMGGWNYSNLDFFMYFCLLSSKTSQFSWNTTYYCLGAADYDDGKRQTTIKILPSSYTTDAGKMDYDSIIFAAFQKRNEETGLPQGQPATYPVILYHPFFQSI